MKTERHNSCIFSVFTIQVIILFLLLMPSFKLFAADFYVGRDISIFTVEEQQLLDEFGIRFVRLSRISQINKHNTEVNKLIAEYGNNWKDSLNNPTGSFGESNKKFITFLFTNQSVNFGIRPWQKQKRSCSLSYHTNGMIIVHKVKTSLKKDGGGMYHYRIDTKNWNKKREKIEGTHEVFYGST